MATAMRKGGSHEDVKKRLYEIVEAIENGEQIELKEVGIARLLNDRIEALESALIAALADASRWKAVKNLVKLDGNIRGDCYAWVIWTDIEPDESAASVPPIEAIIDAAIIRGDKQ